MFGIGVPELLVITLVVALLFGAPILTFFMGYVVGKNRAAASPVNPAAESAPAPAPEPAPGPAAPTAPTPQDQPSTPKEPADE